MLPIKVFKNYLCCFYVLHKFLLMYVFVFVVCRLSVRNEELAGCLAGGGGGAVSALLQASGLNTAQLQAFLTALYREHSSIVPY
jgi:hypothetical protein